MNCKDLFASKYKNINIFSVSVYYFHALHTFKFLHVSCSSQRNYVQFVYRIQLIVPKVQDYCAVTVLFLILTFLLLPIPLIIRLLIFIVSQCGRSDLLFQFPPSLFIVAISFCTWCTAFCMQPESMLSFSTLVISKSRSKARYKYSIENSIFLNFRFICFSFLFRIYTIT